MDIPLAGHRSHGSRGAHGASGTRRRPLLIALVITATFLVVEIIGGLLTGSLALLADAGHMATDVAALALSLGASWLAGRPATPQYSFGFRRAEVLAAFVNAASLLAISVYVFWEAFQRFGDPPHVDSGPMFVVAVAGLVANVASAAVLARGGGHSHDLNTRGAFLHVIGDALGSVGAIVAALVMLATGWYLADPILSAGIGLLIVWSSWRLLRESVDVLLESTPDEMDSDAVRAAMAGIDGVDGVHDLHIWTVTSGLVSLSAHVELANGRPWEPVLLGLSAMLRQRFGIVHVTLQPETIDALPHSFRGCSIDTPEGQAICQVPAEIDDGHNGETHDAHEH